jgi:hypothetical protein
MHLSDQWAHLSNTPIIKVITKATNAHLEVSAPKEATGGMSLLPSYSVTVPTGWQCYCPLLSLGTLNVPPQQAGRSTLNSPGAHSSEAKKGQSLS